jgi:hypothetical protein
MSPAQGEILCELDVRFKPELGFSVSMLNVDMRARLFSREEIEAKPTLSEDRRAHGGSVSDRRTATKLRGCKIRKVDLRAALRSESKDKENEPADERR